MAKDKAKYLGFDLLGYLNDLIDKITIKLSRFDSSSNLKQRLLSTLVLLPLAVYAIAFSKGLFLLLTIAVTILMTFEWLELIKSTEEKDQQKWRLIGFFYILIPVWSVLKLREIDGNVVLWMFAIIWTTDIFAYFAGKNLGGPKLSPKISPNKTWSGLIGGVAASIAIGFLSSFMFVSGNIVFFMVVSGILALIEQASDLLESKFKRIFGVKDIGNIIPGHGGVLDRLDGLMLVAPVTLILFYFCSGRFIVGI